MGTEALQSSVFLSDAIWHRIICIQPPPPLKTSPSHSAAECLRRLWLLRGRWLGAAPCENASPFSSVTGLKLVLLFWHSSKERPDGGGVSCTAACLHGTKRHSNTVSYHLGLNSCRTLERNHTTRNHTSTSAGVGKTAAVMLFKSVVLNWWSPKNHCEPHFFSRAQIDSTKRKTWACFICYWVKKMI